MKHLRLFQQFQQDLNNQNKAWLNLTLVILHFILN